jgi:hypothetical protein
MSDAPYVGVYSAVEAGTNIGTEVKPGAANTQERNKLSFSSPNTKGRQYQTISKATLEDSDLNVAKIRLVSTLPGKEIHNDLKGKAYVGFILTAAQESHTEKVEIVPLPGDSFASYFYGANPRTYSFSGILLNTDQDQWRDSFEQIYEKYLRGSVSSRDFSIVQVSYSGRVVSGWLTNMSQQLNSENDHYASFSFSVLVSRVDMVGGSKNFSDYLVTLPADGGEFAQANLDTDYAVLDPSNYNGMINPIRTGMVIPPKRPHKKRRRKAPTCFFPARTTNKGVAVNSGAATNNTHINDATTCTVTERIVNSQKRIKEARGKAEALSGKALKASTSKKKGQLLKDAQAQSALATKLEAALQEGRSREDVKSQLAAENKASIDYVVAESRKVDSKGRPTKKALAAKRVLKGGVIDVSGATVDVETMLVDDQGSTSYVAGEFLADPEVYDGTEASDPIRQKAISTLTRTSDEQALGAFDKVNESITEKKKEEAAAQQAERNRKAANKIRARVKITL